MGWRFVRQPNGLFARFSEIVDDFTDYDLSVAEAVFLCMSEHALPKYVAEVKIQSAIDSPGLNRWNEALETIEICHGKKHAIEIKTEIGKIPNQ